MLKGLIKFVVGDAKTCIMNSRMKRTKFTPPVTKLQPVGMRKQGRLSERLLQCIEPERKHVAEVLERSIIIIIIIIIIISQYMLQMLCDLTYFFDHL
jgi:hypothetical protein